MKLLTKDKKYFVTFAWQWAWGKSLDTRHFGPISIREVKRG